MHETDSPSVFKEVIFCQDTLGKIEILLSFPLLSAIPPKSMLLLSIYTSPFHCGVLLQEKQVEEQSWQGTHPVEYLRSVYFLNVF